MNVKEFTFSAQNGKSYLIAIHYDGYKAQLLEIFEKPTLKEVSLSVLDAEDRRALLEVTGMSYP